MNQLQDKVQVSRSSSQSWDAWAVNPAVLRACLEVLSKPFSSAKELCLLVAKDPVMALRLLAEANTLDQDPQAAIFNLSQAAQRLGKKRIEEVLFGLYIRQIMEEPSLEGMEEFWASSQARAAACRGLSGTEDSGHAEIHEEAYLCGLLADLGKLGLRQGMPGPAWAGATCEEERSACGTDHAELGACIARELGFPASFCEGIRLHHGAQGESWMAGLIQQSEQRP